MSIATAQWLTLALASYALLGLLFALPFVLRGAGAVDPSARQGTWGFRLLIVPGVVAFWPLLAYRWATGRQAPEENNPHRRRARQQEATG